MSGNLVPQNPAWRELRLSDAERERVVERLRVAAGEGRLSLSEFEQRVDGVLAARTVAEVEPYVADLPGAADAETLELRTSASSIKRRGYWLVPRRLTVSAKAASVKLDFTDASLPHHEVEVILDSAASSVQLILPRGASAQTGNIEMHASAVKSRLPDTPTPGGVHFVISGKQRASSLKIRYQRRFWRWRW